MVAMYDTVEPSEPVLFMKGFASMYVPQKYPLST